LKIKSQSKESKKSNKSRNKKKNNYNYKVKEGIPKIYREDNIYFNYSYHYDENYDSSIIRFWNQNGH